MNTLTRRPTRQAPFREAFSLRNMMDQLMEQSFVRPDWGMSSPAAAVAPEAIATPTIAPEAIVAPMALYETEQSYKVYVLLPGAKPEDVELTATEDTLTIRGQFRLPAKEEKPGKWLLQEVGSETFERSITFPRPIDTDKIQTSYENGVLTISVPTRETSHSKRISIAGGQPQQGATAAGQPQRTGAETRKQ